MKNNFHDYKFSELYDINSGISSTKEQAGHGAPFVTFSDVFNNYFLPDTLSQKMDTSVKEQEKCSVKEGDIFLTRTSETLDELAMSSVAVKNYPHATFSGFLKRLRPKKKNVTYAKYMAFYLRGQYFRKIIDNNATMTLRASFNEDIFSWLHLLLPSYNEQKKIGDWLFSIEQKMQLNNKMNATLEAMAKTLYDYWFVQFDFPDEHGRPYKTSGGSMTYNEELGREIPTGWEVGKLNQFIELQKETINPKLFPNQLFEHYSIPAYDAGRIPVFERGIDIHSGKYKVNEEVILYSKLNPQFKRIWKPYCFTDNMVCSTEWLVFLPKDKSITGFIYAILNSDYYQLYMIQQAASSTGSRSRVQPENSLSYAFAKPTNEILYKFSDIYKYILEKEYKNLAENRHLTQLRDFLLPLLMNGQVTFK